MPRFRMTYPYPRLFPHSFGLVEPGDVVEAQQNPDGNFFEEMTDPVAAGSATFAPVADDAVKSPTQKRASGVPAASTETEEAKS